MALRTEKSDSLFVSPAALRMVDSGTSVGRHAPELELGVSMEIALEAVDQSGLFDRQESHISGGEKAFLVRSKPDVEPWVSFTLVQEFGGEVYVVSSGMERNLGLPLVHYLRARIENPDLFQEDQKKTRPDARIYYQDERLKFSEGIDEVAKRLQDSKLFHIKEITAYRPGSDRIIEIETMPPGAQPDIFAHLVELEEQHGGGVFLVLSSEDTKNAVVLKAYIDAVLESSSHV